MKQKKSKREKKQYVVIGMDRFGKSVAVNLEKNGCMVLAVDKDQKKINQISEYVTAALCLDITDEEATKDLGFHNFDGAIVSLANHLDVAVLATVIIKEQGIPLVVAEAYDNIQGKVLEKVGVDRVIYSEQEMGIHLANNLAFEHLIDSVDLSADYTIAEIQLPGKFVGKTLIDLNLRRKHEINVIAIKRDNHIDITPLADKPLLKNDILVIIGRKEKVNQLSNEI